MKSCLVYGHSTEALSADLLVAYRQQVGTLAGMVLGHGFLSVFFDPSDEVGHWFAQSVSIKNQLGGRLPARLFRYRCTGFPDWEDIHFPETHTLTLGSGSLSLMQKNLRLTAHDIVALTATTRNYIDMWATLE